MGRIDTMVLFKNLLNTDIMKLSAPTQVFFLISLVLFVLALLGSFAVIPAIAGYAFWLAVAAWGVLAIGCLMRGR